MPSLYLSYSGATTSDFIKTKDASITTKISRHLETLCQELLQGQNQVLEQTNKQKMPLVFFLLRTLQGF